MITIIAPQIIALESEAAISIRDFWFLVKEMPSENFY